MSFPTALARAALLTAGLHLAALSCPSVAWAQSAPPAPAPAAAGGDAIYLKNGGILRGTIIDAIPNDRARIQLATHEIATVSWSDITRIEHADGTKQTVGAPPAAAGAAGGGDSGSKALPASQSLVWVHIEGSDDANLEQDTTGQDDWAVVCNAPCDKQVSTAYWYRIAGGGMKASSQFSLRGQPGQHDTITVSPASKGWFVLGVVAMPVGGLVAYIGLIVGLAGALGSTANSAAGNNQGTKVSDGVAATGWTMLVVGLGVAVGGLVLTITNWKTGTTQDIGATKAALLGDAWKQLPVPTWHDASPEQLALPPALGAPVFTGSF